MTTNSSSYVWIGLVAIIAGYVATWLIVPIISWDAAEVGGATLIRELESGNNELIFRLTTGLGLLGAAGLFVFAAGVRRQLESLVPGGSLVPSVVYGAFVASAAALAAGFIFRGMVFDSAGAYGDDPRIAFYVLGVDVPLGAWSIIGVAAAASAYAAFALKALPRWFGVVSAIAALLVAVAWLTGTPAPGNIPAGAWLLVAVFVFRGLGALQKTPSSAALPAPTW